MDRIKPIQTIDCIYVACCKKDFQWVRPCVASIRYYYPHVPVCLLKDEARGAFSTREIERTYRVNVRPIDRRYGGAWALTKLEPLFDPEPRRYFMMDCDIVFIGPVLDALAAIDADFVVDSNMNMAEEDPDLPRLYYQVRELAAFDRRFKHAGPVFNTGQMIATSGLVKREDFATVIDYSKSPPVVRNKKMLSCADQSVLNYLLPIWEREGRLRIGWHPMMFWSHGARAAKLTLDEVCAGSVPCVVHWAGRKLPPLPRNVRGDLLEHFDRLYHQRVFMGSVKRLWRAAMTLLRWRLLRCRHAMQHLAGRMKRLLRKPAAQSC